MDFSPNTNKNSDIKVFQINLNNCMRATDLLTNYMKKKQIDCFSTIAIFKRQ
jgi:hypothetical protein